MDINFVVIGGRLVAPPEHRVLESGSDQSRFLVTVRAARPRRRIDVIPITFWDPPANLRHGTIPVGSELLVCGSVHRRFREGPDGRSSQLEVLASSIAVRNDEDASPCAEG